MDEDFWQTFGDQYEGLHLAKVEVEALTQTGGSRF